MRQRPSSQRLNGQPPPEDDGNASVTEGPEEPPVVRLFRLVHAFMVSQYGFCPPIDSIVIRTRSGRVIELLSPEALRACMPPAEGSDGSRLAAGA